MLRRKYRAHLAQRLGRAPAPPPRRAGGGPRIWIHALSVGEVNAAVPLVRALAARWPGAVLVVTASTATGLETARRRLGGLARVVAALPFDLAPLARRAVRRFDPDAFVLVETDLWPNLLWTLARRGVPAVLVNGSVSARAARRLSRVPGLVRLLYGPFRRLAMQSGDDRDRLAALDVDPGRLLTPGNLKFDLAVPEMTEADRAALRSLMGFPPEAPVWVAGSTHPGEEAAVLAAYAEARAAAPDLRLVVAPRDPGRGADVAAMAAAAGLRVRRRSEAAGTAGPGGTDVFVLDTLGELARSYGIADVAFVGGSLVPVGGHNLLEPAAFGIPVLFGPETESCREVAGALARSGGGVEVADAGALARAVESYLADPPKRREAGRRARELVERHRGAVDRTVALLSEILED
nr:glycosyltransferase N-terminal domain-containing protein [Dissulfurirhabdus thermomarina]